jgi:hypothetical protein
VLFGGFAAAAILVGCLGHMLLTTTSGRRIAAMAGWAGLLGAVAAVLAKGLVGYAAWRPGTQRWFAAADFAGYAQGFSVVAMVALAFATLAAAVVTMTLVMRLTGLAAVGSSRVALAGVEEGAPPVPDPAIPNSPDVTSNSIWEQNWRLPSARRTPSNTGTANETGEMSETSERGICVSGGRIRSAAFTLACSRIRERTSAVPQRQHE